MLAARNTYEYCKSTKQVLCIRQHSEARMTHPCYEPNGPDACHNTKAATRERLLFCALIEHLGRQRGRNGCMSRHQGSYERGCSLVHSLSIQADNEMEMAACHDTKAATREVAL
eukprot:1140551-Pelagomonas_calceolata.AAC.2